MLLMPLDPGRRTGNLIEPTRFPDEDRPFWDSGTKEVEIFLSGMTLSFTMPNAIN